MAALIVYAGVKGYQKYRTKRANSSAGNQNKSKNEKSISNLVIPSVTSAHIVPGAEELTEDIQPPPYDLSEKAASIESPCYNGSYPSDSKETPGRSPSSEPVMLGLTLCESPITPPGNPDGHFSSDARDFSHSGVQVDHLINSSGEIFELAGYEPDPEPMSPAPLNVVKRKSSSILEAPHAEPVMTYSSDESEEYYARPLIPERSKYLEVPKHAEVRSYLEPPPVPRKSPARRLRSSIA